MLLNTTSFSARIQKNNTKCIFVCVHKKKLAKPVPLVLCGRELPRVATAIHLGCELPETGTMDHDAYVKKAIFIDKSVKIKETFSQSSGDPLCNQSI